VKSATPIKKLLKTKLNLFERKTMKKCCGKIKASVLFSVLLMFIFLSCWLYKEHKLSARDFLYTPIYVFDWEKQMYSVRHIRFLTNSRLFLATLVRNKAAFLKEWIYFYLKQGIDHIIIYNHNTSDVDTVQTLLAEIHKNKRLVTTITMIDAERSFEIFCSHSIKNKKEHWFGKCQHEAFNHAFQALRNWNSQANDLWFTALDLDEFIWGKKQCLKEVLFKLPLSTEVFFVQGYNFGTSGFHNNLQFQSVLQSHLWRAKDDYKHIKKYFTRVNSKNVLELWSVHYPTCVLGFTGSLGLTDYYLCKWAMFNESEMRFHHYQFLSLEDMAIKRVHNLNPAYYNFIQHQNDTFNLIYDDSILNVDSQC